MNSPLDPYTIKARLFPAFVMLSPIALGAIAWTPDGKMPVASGLGVLVGTGLSFLLAEFVREAGKEKEPALWQSWGGAPTTQLLRLSNPEVNPIIRKQWRARLEQLTGTILPSEGMERTNPMKADQIYEAAIFHLRESRRDKAKLAQVENTSYGFRRNLFSIKPAGIACCIFGLASCGTSIVAKTYESSTLQVSGIPVVCAVMSAFLLVLWIARVNRSWVRAAAFAYAHRILGSLLSD